MINFEIIESPDIDTIGTHVYYKNSLIFGNRVGNLIIEDEEISASHIELVIKNGKLLAKMV